MDSVPADGPFEGNPPATRGIGRVHIYGAGITGLTAAHELALRGFRVRVIDDAQESNELGQLEWAQRPLDQRIAVGGRARTRFMRVERGAPGNFQKGADGERSNEFRLFLKYPANFVPGDRARLVPEPVKPALRDFLNRCGAFTRVEPHGVLHIRIPPSPKPETLDVRRANASALQKFLTSGIPDEAKLPAARIVIMEEDEARQLEECVALPPRRLEDQEGLWLELVHLLPCESGMRIFPAWHRHLLATLEETPLLDAQGNVTGRRVADNLVPTGVHGLAAKGRRIRFLRGAPVGSAQDLMRELKDVASSGHPPADTLQFTLRLWRYMCTCPERRKAEYEKVTWWEYLEGFDPKSGTRRHPYSAAFKRDMQFAPRALAGVDGAWGDARTCGNTLVQLYLDGLRSKARTEGALNGPTTLAWLRPWRRYLHETLKVEFHAGKLTELVLDPKSGRIKPIWQKKGDKEKKEDTEVRPPPYSGAPATGGVEPVDYYVIATDPETAEALTKGLPDIGVVEKLRGFTTTVPANPRGTEKQQGPPRPFPGRVPWDRFQTLTGLQFFFPTSVRLAEGYLTFLDAPWGLSAIHRQQYWATPPTFDRDGFGAVLSVDLGHWEPLEPGQKRPSDCSGHELAREAWRQLEESIDRHGQSLPHASPADFVPPEPAWYHLDRAISFAQERPIKNEEPLLMPIVGDWDRRPGADPWDPLSPSPLGTPPGATETPWRAVHGGYPVHWGQLVFAGPYLKTFTRVTSMEAANESARHAVNAIIDHYLTHHGYPEPPPRPAGVSGPRSGPGREVDLAGLRATPLGEYCHIWDPEQHELPELAPLRELDAKLFASGQPHVWDVLHLEPLARPLVQPSSPERGAESLLELLRKVREGLETLLKGAVPGMKWPPL